VTPGRFHLLLVVDGRPAMHGWWDDEAIARRMFSRWVGERGRAGTRITLTDEETGVQLTAWPEGA
jgi:hypothetical protein